MSTISLEHVNVTVSDPDATAAMLCELFGWKVRWKGPSQMGGRTVHVGTDDQYLAVYTYDDTAGSYDGLNHIGVQVADLDATEARVKAAGLKPFSHQNYAPGRRFYFNDRDGIEFEVVSYDG